MESVSFLKQYFFYKGLIFAAELLISTSKFEGIASYKYLEYNLCGRLVANLWALMSRQDRGMEEILLRSLIITYIQREKPQLQEDDPRQRPRNRVVSFLNNPLKSALIHKIQWKLKNSMPSVFVPRLYLRWLTLCLGFEINLSIYEWKIK